VLIKFSSTEEVVQMANDTEFGLASAVFSRDISKALITANKIHAGTVWVNCKSTPLPGLDITHPFRYRLQPVAQQRALRWIQAVRYRSRIG
jgi:acyl-CoA reductase-like NAD-dependent aldehyde dehydrogenase